MLDFKMPLGQASGMAFTDTISCGKSCHIPFNGNAKTSWLERKKVCQSEMSV